MFNGLNLNLGNLSRLSNAKTRSISAENFTGAKGKGGMATNGTGLKSAKELGQGWKISPSVKIPSGECFEMADIDGPGAIQQIWLTPANVSWRLCILRIYWDNQAQPSVEVPLGDFFGMMWGTFAPISSLPVCVNVGSAFNCYWEMPFRKHCHITLTNLDDSEMVLYYQINYTLTDVPDDCAYFHAQFRRSNPLKYKEVHTILDGVSGQGHYVGTTIGWGANSAGWWWGEGEIKFFLDGDRDFPTICGTGTEDYFCGSYGFLHPKTRQYQEFSTPYSGLHQVIMPDGGFSSQMRFSLYRWHIMDPVRFEQDLKVTIQALGWRSGEPFLPLQDDISSVAFWYQTLPTAPFPALPDKDFLKFN